MGVPPHHSHPQVVFQGPDQPGVTAGPSVRRARATQLPTLHVCMYTVMVNAAQYPSPQARRREPRDQMECLFPNRHICDSGPWVNHHPLPSHINVPNPPWLEKARPFPTTTPPSLLHILAPLVAPLVPRLARQQRMSPRPVSPRLGRHLCEPDGGLHHNLGQPDEGRHKGEPDGGLHHNLGQPDEGRH